MTEMCKANPCCGDIINCTGVPQPQFPSGLISPAAPPPPTTDAETPVAWIWSPRLVELARGEQSRALLEPKLPVVRPDEYRQLYTADALASAYRRGLEEGRSAYNALIKMERKAGENIAIATEIEIAEAYQRGREDAAQRLDKRVTEIANEYGDYEPDTNYTNLPEEWEMVCEELETLAAAIRAKAAT